MNVLASSGERLGSYRYFDTFDLDEARARFGEAFCATSLHVLERDTAFHARQNLARVQDITVSYVRIDSSVSITPCDLETFFVVQIPTRGRCHVQYGDEEVITTTAVASVVSPVRPLRMTWEGGCTKVVLRVEREAMEGLLSAILGHPLARALEFAPQMPTGAGALATWYEAVQLLITDLERGRGLVQHAIAAASVEDLLMRGLLHLQPNNYSQHLAGPLQAGSVHQVRRVIELIEAHPDRPLTVGTLAAEVALSVRSLHAAFRREIDATPMRYLRDIRMKRVRADLLAARDLPGARVTDIAARWGVTHLGRFAADYRKRYNETPAESLGQGRS